MSDDLFHLEKFSMEQPKPSFKVEIDDIALSAGFHESIVLDIEFADAFTDESAAIFVAIDKIFHDYLLILGRRKRQHRTNVLFLVNIIIEHLFQNVNSY